MKPKVINVFGRTYKIEYKDLTREDKEGETDNLKNLITIDQALKGRDLDQALLHECFHAVLHRIGVSQALDEDLEEIIVDALATFLVDTYSFSE